MSYYVTPTTHMLEGWTGPIEWLMGEWTERHWRSNKTRAPMECVRLDARRWEVQLLLTRWLARQLGWSDGVAGVPGPRFVRRDDRWFLFGRDVHHDFGDIAVGITDPVEALVAVVNHHLLSCILVRT